MSHFSVAVFSREEQSVEGLLEPFSEHLEVKPYRKYEDIDSISFYAKECNVQPTNLGDITQEMLEQAVAKWDYPRKICLVGDKILAENDHTLDMTQRALKNTGIWVPTFSQEGLAAIVEYMNRDLDKEADDSERHHLDEKGIYYYSTYNPISKWDWYVVGGRWDGSLLVKDTSHGEIGEKSWASGEDTRELPKGYKWVDRAKIKDIAFDKMKLLVMNERQKEWHEIHKEVEEMKTEKGLTPEEVKRYLQAYGVKEGDTVETYSQRNTDFGAYAVLNEDGIWFEQGKMGWFGMSSASPTETQDWNQSFNEKFIAHADPEMYLTIVDCHI